MYIHIHIYICILDSRPRLSQTLKDGLVWGNICSTNKCLHIIIISIIIIIIGSLLSLSIIITISIVIILFRLSLQKFGHFSRLLIILYIL